MDYKQDQIFYPQFDVPKMPFYMSYPMQNLYLTELEYEKDMERMKELYPKEVGKILEYVEDECDKMEYEGSLMFDEYPDRLMLEAVVERIYQNMAQDEERNEIELEAEESRRPPYGGPGGPPPPPPGRPPHGGPGGPPPPPPGRPPHDIPPYIPPRGGHNPAKSLIGVLLNNEMYRRRCRHRRCRRWW